MCPGSPARGGPAWCGPRLAAPRAGEGQAGEEGEIMKTITIEVPEAVMPGVTASPEEFAREFRLAAAHAG